jgi:hypothetical protein
VESLKGEFIDSAHYDGWRDIRKIPKDEPNAKFEGIKIKEDEKYIWIAQTEKYPFYGNILKIPKVAIVSISILILLLIFWKHEIKDAILAMIP